MKIKKMIDKLQKIEKEHGDIDVMYQDGDGESYWSINSANFREAEEDEFPEDWEMPEGFKFVLVRN